MSEKRKAVITILGIGFVTDKNKRAEYYFEENLKNNFTLKKDNYTNMFPLLIDSFTDYEIVPIFTKEAKETNQKVLKDENINWDNFQDEYYIDKNETYDKTLKVINYAISQYDEVIFDMSHGFRSLPILATVALITQNIQDKNKIKEIFFAKEIEDRSKYEIVSLLEYLDLANLSFIISNFKDNYTVSKHIQIKSEKYKNLIDKMNSFSSDIMSLSLENLLDTTAIELTNEIQKITYDKDTILINELEFLRVHIEKTFSKKNHRYETYYYLAKELYDRGYLVQALSLLFESLGFYIKTSFSKFSDKLKDLIDQEEKKIKDGKSDYYKLTSACRSYMLFDNDKNTDKKLKPCSEIIYSQVNNKSEFRVFCEQIGDRRNNLLHSNSGETIDNISEVMKDLMQNYEKFCIKDNVLKFDSIRKTQKAIPKKNLYRKIERVTKVNGL